MDDAQQYPPSLSTICMHQAQKNLHLLKFSILFFIYIAIRRYIILIAKTTLLDKGDWTLQFYFLQLAFSSCKYDHLKIPFLSICNLFASRNPVSKLPPGVRKVAKSIPNCSEENDPLDYANSTVKENKKDYVFRHKIFHTYVDKESWGQALVI